RDAAAQADRARDSGAGIGGVGRAGLRGCGDQGSDPLTTPGPQGLQAERTALAWSRTSLAVLANGVLLILKDPHHYDRPAVVAAALAGIVAVAVYVVGLRRQRILARRPLPDRVAARAEVQLLGVAVLVLIAATAVGLFV